MTTADESLYKLLQKLHNTDYIHAVPSHKQLATQAISTWYPHPKSWTNIITELPRNLRPGMGYIISELAISRMSFNNTVDRLYGANGR
jgi:hypothetical protein